MLLTSRGLLLNTKAASLSVWEKTVHQTAAILCALLVLALHPGVDSQSWDWRRRCMHSSNLLVLDFSLLGLLAASRMQSLFLEVEINTLLWFCHCLQTNQGNVLFILNNMAKVKSNWCTHTTTQHAFSKQNKKLLGSGRCRCIRKTLDRQHIAYLTIYWRFWVHIFLSKSPPTCESSKLLVRVQCWPWQWSWWNMLIVLPTTRQQGRNCQ